MKKLSDFALCTQCYHTWQSRETKLQDESGQRARARDCDGRFGDLHHFEADLTDMQENAWARLCDSHTRFSQPSPRIFLHFCT